MLIYRKKTFIFYLIISISTINANERIYYEFNDVEEYVKDRFKSLYSNAFATLQPSVQKTDELPDWMLANIKQELSNFHPFSLEELEECFFNSRNTLVQFRIRTGKLYVRCNNSERLPSNAAEYAMALHWILTQPEFGIASGDYILDVGDGVHHKQSQYPILCFSKHYASNYITIPDWFAVWEDRPSLMLQIDKASEDFPWDQKLAKAFWLGAPNGKDFNNEKTWRMNCRATLVLFALDHPDLIWAKFTNFSPEQTHICQEMHSFAPLLCSHGILPYDACVYKYLIDVDGYSNGFHRCQWILRSNCVSIKQNSGNIQWYYSGLKPYIHYIPYQTDCSDLADIIMWLKENDEKAKQIAINGKEFAKQYLDINTTYLYLYHVLKEYNTLNLSN